MSDKKQSAGGAWIKKSKSGKEFFSVSIGEQRYTMFKNDYKEPGSKQPDYRLFVDDWKPDGSNVKVPETIPDNTSDSLPF